MLDYRGIAALQAVIETQGFESAADKLFITQSAVSQRIKALESAYGEPVLVRALPYRPTVLGEKLLGHLNRVRILEEDLTKDLDSQRIAIAISRDNLETWFGSVLAGLKELPGIHLEIIGDDQDVTLEYLRKGQVSACVSTTENALSGCQSAFLGYFDYVLVASPAFKKQYFNNKQSLHDALLNAPALIFDHKDDLHQNYLSYFFNITEPLRNYHVIPSVAGFRQFALEGYAYALIPEIDIRKELREKKLISLFPEKMWEMPLYWHSWEVETKMYNAFNQLVVRSAKRILRQK